MKKDTINIPRWLKTIPSEAYSNRYNVKKINFHSRVRKVKEWAFSHCKGLETVEIPDSVESIDECAFFACDGLKQVKLPKALKQIDRSVFSYCHSLESIVIPDSVEEIGDRAFNTCKSLHKVEFGKQTKRIGDNAFWNCVNLKSLFFPDELEHIGSECFLGCSDLETVVFNNQLKTIKWGAFAHCWSLKHISLPQNSNLRIGNGVFSHCSRLESVDGLEQLEYISPLLFAGCSRLQTVTFGDSLRDIGNSAFNGCRSLTHIKLPNSLSQINDCAFKGCTGLKLIEMSSNIEKIGSDVFERCSSVEKVIIDGKEFKATKDIMENFDKVYPFLCYAVKNNKFIPKNANIMLFTNANEIYNFYKHSKEWKSVLDAYLKEWKPILSNGTKLELDNAITNLYQVSVAMGLFSGGEDGVRAKEFINNVVLKMSPLVIHNLYGALDTAKHGYVKEFADFYIKNYREETDEIVPFMHRVEFDDWHEEEELLNYTANAYNNWSKVKQAYPNRTVLANRERGSENNNLTEEDIFNALSLTYYEDVDEDNEEMAEIVGRYGYTQDEFEDLQEWYNIAKEISKRDLILNVTPDTQVSGVTYELLEKTDPETLILGEKTNCCQTVNNVGSSCVEYGVTKPNSRFIKFSFDGKIVGQSWVWYNEKTGVICLDNIEVPTVWQKELHKKEFQKSFIDCVKRLALSFEEDMKKAGYKVIKVTIGSGFNDLTGINHFELEHTSKLILPKDYDGYSDATSSWHVVSTKEKKIFKDEALTK